MKPIFTNSKDKGEVNTTTGMIVLQRQGCSETVNMGHPMFFVEISKYANDDNRYCYSVSYGDRDHFGSVLSGQYFERNHHCGSFEEAKKLAIKSVNKLAAKSYENKEYYFADFIEAYMFGFGINPKYCESDKIISPFKVVDGKIYDELDSLTAVWDSVAKECQIITDNKDEYNAIIKALKNGFHNCDTRKGVDHCVRRLAWLAGEYLKSAIVDRVGRIHCMVLDNKMEEVK